MKQDKGTILLVDDEVILQTMIKRVLGRFGYATLLAGSGEEAEEVYREKYAEINMVLLDIILPGISGMECLERLLHINPHARIIVASGEMERETAQDALQAGAINFLKKPYEIQQLLETIRENMRRENTAES